MTGEKSPLKLVPAFVSLTFLEFIYSSSCINGEKIINFIVFQLDEALFEIVAEDFIASEVIAPEVKDEATAVARETIQSLDNKIMRKELKEVSSLPLMDTSHYVSFHFVFMSFCVSKHFYTKLVSLIDLMFSCCTH